MRAYTVAKATVNCRLSSVKVTASFAQEIKDNFEYSLVVENSLASLLFDAATEGKAGYFSADRTIADYNRDIWKLR